MDIQFGNYRLKRAERLLLGPEGPVELSARSFDILVTLLAKPERVVSKSELFDVVWPNLVVEENTLQVHISALRKVLAPGMIATVHGRGYKYSGPRPLEVDADKPGDPSLPRGRADPMAPTGHKPVIAVLPFVNVSGDAEQEYFSDGITEDIIVALSRYRPLNVVSRHSSSCFKGVAVDVREVAEKLGAQYLVEGSVRKVGGGVRITAQLLEAATASHVWADRYDRMLDDVLAVQDELVRRLASTIVGHVEMHTDSRARTKATESLDAYDCWLRANHGSVLWTPEGNLACQRFLEQAIKRDPLFARAHASLAFCHIRTATMNPGSEQIAALHRAAVLSAEHAVRLDAFEARARNALGWSQMYFREFERARSEFMQAAALNPNDGSACIDRALALAFLGEQDAADETAEIAAVLNPLGGEWYWSVRAMVHFVARRHDAAEACFMLASRDSPDVSAWHASNLTHLGRHRQAEDRMRHSLERLGLQWRGTSPMQPQDFLGWFRHVNMLRRDEDWDHLVAGFPKDVLLPGDRVGA
ncbi:MAG: adenylate cyclase [Rhizobiaceae bacterium]|nr:MAG: adenylate cyclase [Rhizobiaceae bacterium]CAG0999164.1 adenylate cyclase [Rhizobiaceae bacterium]